MSASPDKKLYRYRVPVIRTQTAFAPHAWQREYYTVHATNGIAAMLLARLVSGADMALEADCLGEVDSPADAADPLASNAACGGMVVWA
jgi:hypothetical protein